MEVLGLTVPGWCISIILILVTLCLYSKWKHSLWSNLGIPGPKPVPFLGIFPSYHKKGVYKTDLELIKKYGDVVGFYHGHDKALLISDPEMIKEILIKKFSAFPQRAIFFKRSEISNAGLVNCSKDPWKLMRTTISPSFTSGRLKQMTEKILTCCECLIDRLKQQGNIGGSVDMFSLLEGFAMNVISSTAFGVDISNKETNDTFVYYGKKAAVGNIPYKAALFISTFPFLKKWINIITLPDDVREFFTSVVQKAVEVKGAMAEKEKDFLQLIINAHDKENHQDSNTENSGRKALTEMELVINSLTFYLAGMGTVSMLLGYCCYVLATEPKIQEELVKEVDAVLNGDAPSHEILTKMPYLDRFVSEVLRLYPPGHRLSRENLEDITVKGVFIPKMTHIIISVLAMHKNPKYWPNPEKFDPNRFTEDEKAKRPEICYMPFGLGPRICVGMRLAQMEAKMGLIRLVQNFEFSKSEKTEVPPTFGKGIVLEPVNGIIVKVNCRKKSQ